MKRDQQFDLLALITALSLALAFRLPGLTVFITADEARSWFGRSLIFLDSLLRGDLANTGPGGTANFIENVSLSPAPGVTTMWAGTVGMVWEYVRQGMPGSLVDFVVKIPFDPLNPGMLPALRLPGVLLAAAAVGVTYWWSRPLLGRWAALLAACFLALDPFYLALSRILGHDALVTTFMWLSLLAFLRFVSDQLDNDADVLVSDRPQATDNERRMKVEGRENADREPGQVSFRGPRFTFLLLSGGCAGLAFLSKYPALFIGAFEGLALLTVYLAAFVPRSALQVVRVLKRWFIDMVGWSLAAGVVFVLFWPAMWVDPLGPITAIITDALRASGSTHQKGSFFLGQPVADPGALFYPLIILLRTTPVVFLGFLLSVWALLRTVKIGRRLADGEGRRTTEKQQPTDEGQIIGDNQSSRLMPGVLQTRYYALILLAYLILYTLLVTYGGKKQDRYILPAFPAVGMLAAVGYLYVTHLTAQGIRPTRYALRRPWLVPGAAVVLQIIFVLPYHPYYFSYYNPFAGGGTVATRTVQVGWGEGLNEAAAYLNRLPQAESTRVVSWYSTTFEPYFNGKAIYKIEDEKISRSAKPGLAADFVVFYINQVQRELPTPGALQYFRSGSPVYTVTLQGIDYAWVYPSVSMTHVIADEVRLVGQAELLGYHLKSEAGRPVTAAYPESVVILSLYWEWQGKAEAEPIRISLLDDEGITRGWGNPIETTAPLPYDQWQEGMIVQDDFALVIFPDTLPGVYRLSAWIERPSTGETVGVFPLDDKVMMRIVPPENE